MRAWIIIALIALATPFLAHAAAVEVTVAKRGKDATEARELAIADAEQRAFRKLLEERVPDRVEAIIKSYEPSHISALVQSYEVLDERMTDTSYRAKFKMSFSDRVVEQLTRSATKKPAQNMQTTHTTHSDAAPPLTSAPHQEAILVLPVFRDERGIMLWDEANQWREWMNKAAIAGKGKLVMPFGDPTDRLMIDSGNVTTASYGLLQPLMERYGAQSAVVAIAEPVYNATPPLVNVTLRHLMAHGTQERQLVLEDTLVGEALKAGSHRVIHDILTAKQRRIEAATTIPLLRFPARMNFSQMRDWVAARRRIEEIPGIEAITIENADWGGMEFELAFRGSPEQLGMEMDRVDLRAEKQGNLLLIGLK